MASIPGRWMREEILEQPQVISRVLDREQAAAEGLGAELRSRKVQFAVLAARGTSDHAAMLGQYFLEWAVGIPVALAAPSMATLYRKPMRFQNAAVLGVSQSGRSPDVIEYLRRARRAGAITIAVTNDASSPLAGAAHHALLCHAGVERSVAATKTFTAQAACLYLLGAGWTGGYPGRKIFRALRAVPEQLQKALTLEDSLKRVMVRRRQIDRCVVLGRGFTTPVALEIALKLKEAAGVFADGQSAADFMHGPISMALAQGGKGGMMAILLAPRGPEFPSMERAAKSLLGNETRVIALACKRGLAMNGTSEVLFPFRIPDWLAPFPWSVMGQLAAYHLSRAKGLDPDRPVGLRKITKTY